MKKFIALFLFSLIVVTVRSQTNVNADCINAIPLCNTPSFTFFATSGPGAVNDFSTGSTVSNPTNDPFPPTYGCLKSGELNPQWLLLTVGNAGLLEFVFGAGNSQHPQAGCYDWSMWPYSSNTCANILNNTLPPIRCNWNGTCNNGTGIASATNIAAVGGSTIDFGQPLQVNACQQFIICISNYSGVNTLVSFQSMGTASLSCNPNCSPSYTVCAGSSATVFPVNYAGLTSPVYSMEPGGLSNSTGSFVVTPTATTVYSTSISGINLSNVSQTITGGATVTINQQPSSVPTLTQTTCTSSLTSVNLNLNWTPSGTPPSYTVAWSPIPNGFSNTAQTAGTTTMIPGPYSATITSAGGCSTIATFTVDPQPIQPQINLSPAGFSHTVTCYEPVITLSVLDAANSYTWSNGLVAPVTGTTAQMTFTSTGIWTITAVHPVSKCVQTQTLLVTQNTVAPTSVVSPSIQNITCSVTSVITVTASANPTVNVSHIIMAPQGGTYTAASHTLGYLPGGVGVFTHCAVNDVNGCKTCDTFTVTSNQGFPVYNVVSPNNFSLGCGTTSVATINIIGATTSSPTGGPVSYTILGPPTSTATPSGSLSSNAVYTVNAPGSWTVITKDNNTFCETRTPISILQNTFAPNISALVPQQILSCMEPKTKLRGQSTTKNVAFNWTFPGNPGNLAGDTIAVAINSVLPTNSLVANFTLTITDKSSTCSSTSVIPIYQNTFPPSAVISNGGVSSLSCKVPTVMLTNQSTSTIPPNIGFPSGQPVIGYFWDGPTPQVRGQLSTTYLGATPGTYTMTGKDLNNGCTTRTTISIADNRIYPILNNPVAAGPFTLDCSENPTQKIYPIITNSNPAMTYSWTSPPGAVTSIANTLTLTTNSIGAHRIVVTNTANGCASSALINVTQGFLSGEFLSDKITGFAPLAVTFTNTSKSSLDNLGITTVWSFGNGTSSVSAAPGAILTTNYAQPGRYTVTVFALKGKCRDTVIKYITVDIPSELEIPNIFTPNGDGVNDEFFVKAANIADMSMSVIDRWGHVVYEVSSTSGNVLWTGKNQLGVAVADGVYFYKITGNGTDGTAYNKNGTITVTR